jgi:hypothetical protein
VFIESALVGGLFFKKKILEVILKCSQDCEHMLVIVVQNGTRIRNAEARGLQDPDHPVLYSRDLGLKIFN